jgi:hypothetical protein
MQGSRRRGRDTKERPENKEEDATHDLLLKHLDTTFAIYV